ncbi:hypothetical protein F4811DRAFT_572492 [Daldinia bambusicola]|nr:hypothetical protein F4811DRAFT_572492 [Daldinia bambusicola]
MPPPEFQGGIDNDGKKRKRNQKDNSSEDRQAMKRPRRAIKSVQSEPKTMDVKKRKRGQDDDATEDHSKKSDISDKNFEPKVAVASQNKRQHDQETKFRYETSCLELAEEKLKKTPVKFLPMDNLDLAYSRFDKLRYAISDLVKCSLVKVYDKDAIPEHVEKRFKEMSQTPLHKFLRVSSYAGRSFEALIWHFLCTEFMEDPFKLSDKGNGIGHALREIQVGKYGGDTEALIAWRTHTTQILYDSAKEGTRLKGLQERLLGLIETFVVEEKQNNAKHDIESRVEKISSLQR